MFFLKNVKGLQLTMDPKSVCGAEMQSAYHRPLCTTCIVSVYKKARYAFHMAFP